MLQLYLVYLKILMFQKLLKHLMYQQLQLNLENQMNLLNPM
jgi:hypothetical protein